MKKHLEYLRNGTALVTLFVEAAFTRPLIKSKAIEVDRRGNVVIHPDKTVDPVTGRFHSETGDRVVYDEARLAMTPQQAEAIAYINRAGTPEERRERKIEMFGILYSANNSPIDISLAFPSAKMT